MFSEIVFIKNRKQIEILKYFSIKVGEMRYEKRRNDFISKTFEYNLLYCENCRFKKYESVCLYR